MYAIILFLSGFLVCLCNAYIIQVEGGRFNEQCFKEIIHGKSVFSEILFRFEVLDEVITSNHRRMKGARLTVSITTPSGRTASIFQSDHHGVYAERAFEDGDYEICFRFRRRKTKTVKVEFEWIIKEIGTRLAFEDVAAMAVLQRSNPDKISFTKPIVKLAPDDGMVMMRFDLREMKDWTEAYGDKWSCVLKLHIPPSRPTKRVPIARISHLFIENGKAASIGAAKGKVNAKKWEWTPHDISFRKIPSNAVVIDSIPITSKVIELDLTIMMKNVLSHPQSERQLTLQLEAADASFSIFTIEHSNANMFPVLLFDLTQEGLGKELMELEKSVFLSRTDQTLLSIESKRSYKSSGSSNTRLLVSRFIFFSSLALISLLKFMFLKQIVDFQF